ncbi:MAG: cation diffusion facilitator family transporter [Planctomycetaceae bacterium]|jgi:cation diffusion facilitator family transporter|nr:cation diffusion facilitator family transporter [Planctomycetaceae bacterium]
MATRTPDPAVSRRARAAARWAIAVGVAGFGLKLSGWLLTDSDAVFSDALESIVNIVASLGAFFAIRYADQPPDEEHPYGHGPIEFVSALFEGVLIGVAGVVILTQCAQTFYRGRAPLESIDLGLALVLASALLNGIAGIALLRVGRATGSEALVGDGKHLLSDLWTTCAVVAGLVAVKLTGHAWIDTAVATAVGVLLLVVGARVGLRGLSAILGRQDEADHREITRILEEHRQGREPRICSFASVRHRHQGRVHFIDMHLRLPRGMSVADSHEVASAIEHEVLEAVGDGTATAHVEPCGDAQCPRCRGGAG